MPELGNIRKPDFIEEEFISGFETILARAQYPTWQLEITRISQSEENLLGYDGILNSLVPFYIQFKRSFFYLPQYNGELKVGRRDKSLPTERGFFGFSLLRDKKSKEFLQHNALFRLSETNSAAYVAPMFYKRERLKDFKRMDLRLPWSYQDLLVYESYVANSFPFKNTKSFKDCATVPPHKLIENHEEPSHHYTYTANGDLCFHSDPEIPEEPMSTFYDFISSIERSVAMKRRNGDTVRKLIDLLPELYGFSWGDQSFDSIVESYLSDLGLDTSWQSSFVQKRVNDLDEFSSLLLLEEMLYRDFNIVQYVAFMY
jgi:hypothetical protein